MNVQDILALTNAGWSKAEILALNGVEAPQENPTVETKPDEVAQPNVTDEQTAPAPQPVNQIALTEEQMKQLVQSVAVQTASGAIEMPKDLTQTLNERLASIMKGE